MAMNVKIKKEEKNQKETALCIVTMTREPHLFKKFPAKPTEPNTT